VGAHRRARRSRRIRRELRAPLAPGGRVDLACKGAQQLRSAGLGVLDGRALLTRSVAGACSRGCRELRLRPAMEWRRAGVVVCGRAWWASVMGVQVCGRMTASARVCDTQLQGPSQPHTHTHCLLPVMYMHTTSPKHSVTHSNAVSLPAAAAAAAAAASAAAHTRHTMAMVTQQAGVAHAAASAPCWVCIHASLTAKVADAL
jgi:hypothetical protein